MISNLHFQRLISHFIYKLRLLHQWLKDYTQIQCICYNLCLSLNMTWRTQDLIGGAVTGRRAVVSSLSSSGWWSLQRRDDRFAQNWRPSFGLETLSLHRVGGRGRDVVRGISINKSRSFAWARVPSAAPVSVRIFLFMSCWLNCARKMWAP